MNDCFCTSVLLQYLTGSWGIRASSNAPTAVAEVAMLKKLLEAEKEKNLLKDETIAILKADKVFLQEWLEKKETSLQELMRKPEASSSGLWLIKQDH